MAGFRLAALVFALTFLVLAAKSNGNPLDAEVRHPGGEPGVRDFQEVDLSKWISVTNNLKIWLWPFSTTYQFIAISLDTLI